MRGGEVRGVGHGWETRWRRLNAVGKEVRHQRLFDPLLHGQSSGEEDEGARREWLRRNGQSRFFSTCSWVGDGWLRRLYQAPCTLVTLIDFGLGGIDHAYALHPSVRLLYSLASQFYMPWNRPLPCSRTICLFILHWAIAPLPPPLALSSLPWAANLHLPVQMHRISLVQLAVGGATRTRLSQNQDYSSDGS